MPADAVVAIDGPAGSGKSTTARALARRLGLTYVDTGAMYRALAHAALNKGADPQDGTSLARMLAEAELQIRPGEKEASVLWNGRDVSQAIRAPEVEAIVSQVAVHGEVRRGMVERQRLLGRQGGIVMEGRDIGSVVFPLATAKIYLDASLEARTERRWKQFRERGETADRGQVLEDLAARDRIDSERSVSPLTISPDALVLDSSSLNLEQQIDSAALLCRTNPYLDQRTDWDAERAWRSMSTKYRLVYNVMSPFRRMLGQRVTGRPAPTVPPGVILASNHISWLDPPLVGGTFLRAPIRTLAKRELFLGPLAAAFFRWMDAIPINRRGYDKSAFDAAKQALEQGNSVFIFPEGTRRPAGRPGPLKGGLGILAMESGAPILPVFVRGTCALSFGGNPRSPFEVRYGPLVRLHALPRLRRDHDRREISSRISALFLAIFEELQACSYSDNPQTAFELQLLERQTRRRGRRNPFGRRAANSRTMAD